ncbi:MAG: GTPase Era [Saprospiraceae bacterium]|jgi:GTP-binding protein Era|nr:GTPase Era [Saprospiraceae bacterium]MBK6665436.1 GTPase Era [Saprospiraceae bacterium]MBK7699560.1 GTPase Era [Saprospiraceae bacterium]MBK8825677.1 GTPase Era [Saprospiraceae bacterium]MBK9582813.1 GTPase Era [Saprospiraceae bacterium]
MNTHKSGFVNIIGNPNVGKSTLMNALVGEKMSIVTSKPQTTRHRIFGILNEDDYQIVFSDTPGIIEKPIYGMQSSMNKFAFSSFEDADILLFVTDIYEKYTGDEPIVNALKNTDVPKYLIINKTDLDKENTADDVAKFWEDIITFNEVFFISAEQKINTDTLLTKILSDLPEAPAYYPKDELSDKPERFFVSEMIRENILSQYKQEVPYSCEVVVTRFKEEEKNGAPLLMIWADIYVDRKSQKPIIIGKGGEAIKKLGIASRLEIEAFFGKHTFLDLNVKIRENWRNDERMLKHFGYEE